MLKSLPEKTECSGRTSETLHRESGKDALCSLEGEGKLWLRGRQNR